MQKNLSILLIRQAQICAVWYGWPNFQHSCRHIWQFINYWNLQMCIIHLGEKWHKCILCNQMMKTEHFILWKQTDWTMEKTLKKYSGFFLCEKCHTCQFINLLIQHTFYILHVQGLMFFIYFSFGCAANIVLKQTWKSKKNIRTLCHFYSGCSLL